MKNYHILLLLLLITTFSTLQAQKVEDSVVDILTGTSTVGIGFVWPDQHHIVTALHVVAGRSDFKIKSYTPGQKGIYKVEKVEKILKEADLALLKLEKPINVAPLRVSNATPNAGNQYTMYRTAPGGGQIGGFTKRLESNIETLQFYIGKSKPKLYNALQQQGYPQVTVKIARLIDPIKKGDSGSPICNENGEVVGIIDGGLYEGLRDYNWAIIASTYLDKLNSPSNVEAFASVSETNPNIYLVTEEIVNEEPMKFKSNSLEKSFTTTIKDINQTLDLSAKEIKESTKYYNDVVQTTGRNIGDAKVDIYQDQRTGATIAVPNGLKLSFAKSIGTNIYLEASSPSQNVKMIFSISNDVPNDESFGNKFIDDMLSLDFDATWEIDDDEIIEFSDENYECYEYLYFNDDGGEANISLLYFMDNFLGLGAYILDYDEPTKEDEYYYELFSECILLSDFPVY